MSSNPSSQSGQSPPPPRSQEAGQLEGASADQQPLNISFAKGTKRKRLAKVRYHGCHLANLAHGLLSKACDACHKSKRRCDGTGEYTIVGAWQACLTLPLTSPMW